MRVAVCGSSLYMAGLAASLQTAPDVAVSRIPADTATLAQCLDELAPAVIAFDLAEMPTGLALALLRERPGLLLLGVDPDSEELLVLSGHAARALSVADLVEIIGQKGRDSGQFK